MKRAASLFLGLFLLAPLVAQPGADPDVRDGVGISKKALVKGPDATVAGDYFRAWWIPGGASVDWTLTPHPPGAKLHEFPGAHSVAVWVPPGTYELTAKVTVYKVKIPKLPKNFKDGDTVDAELTASEVAYLKKTFTASGWGPVPPPDPGPGPGPGPPPTPPDPKPPDPPAPDTFVVALKTAAAADQWPHLAKFATALRDAAGKVANGQTGGQAQAAVRAALARGLPEGVPPNVTAVVAPKLAALDSILPPSAPQKMVTESEKLQVRGVLNGLAQAAEEAAR
jgi:hypothetical protein